MTAGAAGCAGAAVWLFASVGVVPFAGVSAAFGLEHAAKNELKTTKVRNFGIRSYIFPPFKNTVTLSQTDSKRWRFKKSIIPGHESSETS
jgi:hypothetical protein